MRRRGPSRLPTFVIFGLRFGTRYLRSRKLKSMVTSIAPILEQHMARAQARAGGQDAHVRFDFVAYLDSSTSTTQLAKQTLDQSHVEDRNRAGEYCCNQQYSVTAITTATGAIAERYAYTAYGLPTILNASATIIASSAISNRYTYTGREWDATLGLHHFRARWMSPIAGRFLGRDPIGFEGSQYNLSEFLGGKPIDSADPTGLLWVECYPFYGLIMHCSLQINCTPGYVHVPGYGDTFVTCDPVTRSKKCSRQLYDNNGPCGKNCCDATDLDVLTCLEEFPYQPGQSCWGDNCQANTAHRLAKCCLETSWTPHSYGFPSGTGMNPHCLKWGWETKYICKFGVCHQVRVRVCLIRLPDDYYGQPSRCASGHYETRYKIGIHQTVTPYTIFVCDTWENWTIPPTPGHIPFI